METVIIPEQIESILAGDVGDFPPDTIFVCEGVKIAIRSDGKTTKVACDHPCHGAHPKYVKMYSLLNGKYGHILDRYIISDISKCPKCKGETWLDIGSPEGKKQIVLSLAFRMFRGIPIKLEQELKPVDFSGTISSFLDNSLS